MLRLLDGGGEGRCRCRGAVEAWRALVGRHLLGLAQAGRGRLVLVGCRWLRGGRVVDGCQVNAVLCSLWCLLIGNKAREQRN